MPAPSHPQPSVVLDSVHAGYGGDPDVLAGVSLAFEGPGLTHVVGPNGTGKSTLLELVSGYLRPRSGRVTVCQVPADRPEARALRRVTRTAPALYGDLTVGDHLTFASRFLGPEPEHRASTWRRAEEYGLGPWLDTAASQLSTGNARKLWLVMSTTGSPAVMVLDEPFNALDAHGSRVLTQELHEWAQTRTVLLIAHDLVGGVVAEHEVSLVPLDVVR